MARVSIGKGQQRGTRYQVLRLIIQVLTHCQAEAHNAQNWPPTRHDGIQRSLTETKSKRYTKS